MTNPDKGGENSSHSPMTISEFNEGLKKESPELFQQLHAPDSNSPALSSEKNFLEALKNQAPKLYEKLKNSNFKFKLDQEMLQDWQETIDHSKKVTSKLREMEDANPQGNKQ